MASHADVDLTSGDTANDFRRYPLSEDAAMAGSGKTLDQLLMQTGDLATLMGADEPWTTIARDLKEVFLAEFKKVPVEHRANYAAYLCTAYYAHDQKLGLELIDHKLADKRTFTQVSDVVTFLQQFMYRNGQWDYIRRQPWFANGDYVIAVDINYYPDRSGYKSSPVFHKDTGGNNLFVNLIFDNISPIEATEWFADLEQPSKARSR